jgi:hypothetical protein
VVVAPAPVVERPAPVVPAQPKAATPKPKPKARPATKRPVRLAEPAPPHDRGPVPLASFVSAAQSLDDGLLAVAGGALLLVALGGLVALLTGRRLLREGLA